MIFSERNKKKKTFTIFAAFVFAAGFFLLIPSTAHASLSDAWESIKVGLGSGNLIWGSEGSLIVKGIGNVFKGLIYAVFVLFSFFASAALTLFEWVIKPENISGDTGLLNQPNIYEMWKFIRDFFNLFFILVLLYIAFTVVFQIQKNFKQALLSLVLAALFVNFSYPISRALIDVTNVPMYFFANQITGIETGKGTFSQTLTVSKIEKILLPGSENGGDIQFTDTPMVRFLAATVFMFIFAITLVVLALMFVVRLVALMILVVFSSVGFAASIIPGLDKYSKMWWDNFWKYALFGPAAMLMLLVATRFFSAMGDENAGVFGGLKGVAGSISTDPTFIASMAMFSFPIIILWMAMGLAQTMSIAGASSVVGKGQAFAKWAGRKTYNNPIGRGLGGGIKEQYQRSAIGRFISSPSKTEAVIRGAVGTGTVKGSLAEAHQQAAYKRAEEMKKASTSNPDLQSALHGNDKVAATAAAMLLSERKAIDTPADLMKALEVLGNNTKEAATLIGNASGDALKVDTSTTAGADRYEKLVTSGAFATNPKLRDQLEGKMKKEGHAKVLIDQDINKTAGAIPRQAAYDKYLNKMTAEEVGKTKGIHGDASTPADIEVVNYITTQVGSGNWTPKEHIDAYSKLNAEQKSAWRGAGIQP